MGSWDVLHIGLTKTLGLSIGSWSIILGLAILAFDMLITKSSLYPERLLICFGGHFIDIFNYWLPDIDGFGCNLFLTLQG